MPGHLVFYGANMPTAAENYEDRPVIIYAPQGIPAKQVKAIAERFGKRHTYGDWRMGSSLQGDTLYLSKDQQLAKIVCLYSPKRKPTAYVLKTTDPVIADLVQTSAHTHQSEASLPLKPVLFSSALLISSVFAYVFWG